MCRCARQEDDITLMVFDTGYMAIVDTETGKCFGYIHVKFCPMCGERTSLLHRSSVGSQHLTVNEAVVGSSPTGVDLRT